MATVLDHAFETISAAELDQLPDTELDALDFGVIGFDAETAVQVYNATESRLAGLSRDRVLGQPFFAVVAQCMNNYLVAQRFADEAELDAIIPYVLTLRMRPTPVRLRLLATAGGTYRYILVAR